MNTLALAYVLTFERNVRFLAQQKGSKLRSYCQFRGENSKSHNWDRVGKLTATTKAGRAVASPVNDTPFSRRADAQTTKHVGDLIEPEDLVQVMIDPTSAITTACGYALGRALDSIIIAGATGAASDGAGGTTNFPAGQIIGDGTSAITVDLIASVTQQFMANDIDADVRKVMVVGPLQVRQVANLDKATSTWFVNAKALITDGFVKDWMGYDWVYSNLLTAPGPGQLDCLAFSENALGLHMTKDVWARVEEDPSRSFAWQVYSAFTAGAVRVEDEHIVDFRLNNT